MIGACARAYWIKSGVTLWREASRAGIHASSNAAGVKVSFTFFLLSFNLLNLKQYIAYDASVARGESTRNGAANA